MFDACCLVGVIMNRLIKFIAAIAVSFATAPAFAGVIAQDPLFVNAQADPRVLFLLSRDHQLFIKAYTDYSDLDGDGFLDTSFRGDIEYDGYFNPRKCYTYQNSRFEPTAAATTESVTITLPNATTVTKQQYVCGSSRWSGNLLNWASMTRMDVVRKVLYGGYRSIDTETLTVLERALLPIDVHAFAKVFDAVSLTNLAKFTPYNSGNTVLSFCNVTLDSSNAYTRDSTVVPIIRVASGAYPQWAAGEVTQCGARIPTDPGHPTWPLLSAVLADLNARVKVCDDGGGTDTTAGPGPRCKTYPKGTAKKPIGLIQQYGDADALLGLRFGLMTGSWGKNKSGGVLRRNIGLIANNSGKYPNNYNCATLNEGRTTGDEIDFCTGQFVNNQELSLGTGLNALPTTGGIIGTLNRFRISSYEMDDNKYRYSCDSPGINTIVDGQCVDWGNPISEMYLEALRYLRAGNGSGAAATTAFDSNDSTYIQGLPASVAWQDPIPATEWCAKSNIVILSTGLNSFDTDQTASNDLSWPQTTAQLTNAVADSGHENLSGSYMVGSNTGPGNYDAVCTGKTLNNFSDFSGICPELPNLAGSYHIAGLALGTALYDLRPGYKTKRDNLWLATKPNYAARQPLSTFAVALAENLPEFTIPVGANKITILPGCQSHSTGSALLGATGWRTCSMTDLKVEPGSNNTRGSFTISWEDSAWGNDYDMDGISLIRYCVGSACNVYAGQNGMPASPAANTLYVKAAAMQAVAGFALKFGYTITGSAADGASYPVLRPGNDNYSYAVANENTKPSGSSWTTPTWVAYTPGVSTAKLLKNPLWYTAKYAAWPDWDVKINDVNRTVCTTCDGIPDNFFEVKNPAGLEPAVGTALKESLADPSSASAIATNSTRLDADTFVYQARFKAVNWSGEVLAYPISTAGVGFPLWGAADAARLPAASARQIFTFNRTTGAGVDFVWSGLSAKQKAALDNANAANAGSPILDYLRGDQTNEQPSGSYRVRSPVVLPTISGDPRSGNTVTSLIGDIINSDPIFVGGQNFSYNTISAISGNSAYIAQVSKKVTSSGSIKNPVVLVNSNDGMMHAIDGKNGNELFTYVPSWLICADETGAGCTSGNNSSPLRLLTDPNYQHRYFLDGSLAIGDAYIDKDGAGTNDTLSWKTVVVGAAGAGGKGVFALDVTKTYDGTSTSTAATTASPSVALSNTQTAYSTFLATGAAGRVAMWEFTDKNYGSGTGDVDLGYTFGVPVIGRAANGDWVAIFGNGYNSANGKAVLYVVNLANGQLVRKIDVGDGSTAASPNGLSSPAAIFDTVSGSFSTVYAGDLKGRVWKFDLSSATPASWGIEHGAGTPLFVARDDSGNAQPITGPLEIGRNTAGGYMVYFGTGKYFEKNDNSSTALQTIYGIWDTTTVADAIPDASTNTGAGKAAVLQKHDLLAEVSVTANGVTNKYRVTDTVANIPATMRGWYMNLQVVGGSLQGERVVTTPILRNKRVIYTTLIPSASPCEFGGTSWIMEFDPLTGNRLADSVFDVNGDGSFTSADFVSLTVGGTTVSVPANGIQSTQGIIKAPAIISAGGKEYKIGSGTTGKILVVAEKGSTNRPRASWRQVK